uniref:NADH dehydrogenase subunit 6 n=1 Tax=Opisthoteuthis massyae TaxID=164543 RepID=UPI0022FD83D8|nr:NADH dehydrogenase subunit 6 [Opisthoteuthis massyae]WAP91459.1 NADH dehydrogenase subunit 6 [Opisthoteuthis massyae]WAP91485.1 NADH dehydrogenase subunit 6 [Opisthoteuthis massyae]
MSMMMLLSFGFALISLTTMMIQPLSLGFMLMVISILSSVVVSLISYSWYGYMLFLVYVGGMLVMFMYVISLIPNTLFISTKGFILFFLFFFSVLLVINFSLYNYMNLNVMEFIYMNMNTISMGNSGLIMMGYNFYCYVMLGVLLLFVLISVVKICYYCEGPLRVFKYK